MLDVTAFSNALLNGEVSFVESLKVLPVRDPRGGIVCFEGEDAVVFPMTDNNLEPSLALRMPLEYASVRTWPSKYADLGGASETIARFLPSGMTILECDHAAGSDVALVYGWVPGETLTTRIARSTDRLLRDQLAELLPPLAELGEAMRTSGFVHGDIAPGNLILRPDRSIGLIDLDRANTRGADPVVAPRRRPGYRLPRGGGSPAEEDAFGLLVLMASCSILADSNVPLDHQSSAEETHPAVLFSSWDLMDPRRSRLVREVSGQLSKLSAMLLELLESACTGPSERSPALLLEAIHEIRLAGVQPSMSDPDPPGANPTWEIGQDSRSPSAGTRFREGDAPSTGASWPRVTALPKTKPIHRASGRSVHALLEDIFAAIASRVDERPVNRHIARSEKRRQQVSNELRIALEENDRDVLVRLAMSGALAELGDSERDDLLKVLRALAHETIERAIASDDDRMILDAIDESVFEREVDLDPAFRDRVMVAKDRVRWSDKVYEAVSRRDAQAVAGLLAKAPEGAIRRLSRPIARQASRLSDQWNAEVDAQRALAERDPNALAATLGRLVMVRPVWSDGVDMDAVLDLLGEIQIERRLIAQLSEDDLKPSDQWMVDVVTASGRLPEAIRRSGRSPRDLDHVMYRQRESTRNR